MGVQGVEWLVGGVAWYRREGELRNAMSGLVQPAGDASIDLGSDLTPFFRPPSRRTPTTSFVSSSLVAKPPLPVPGGRRDRGNRRESAGRQGLGVRNGGWGRHEEGWGAAWRRVEDLEVRLARAGPLSYARSLSPPPPPAASSYIRHAAVVLIPSS